VHLSAVVTKDDLALLIEELTPVEIDLGGRRSVTFKRPERIELVPEKGLRLRGDARMNWSLAGITIPVGLRVWQILLIPSIVGAEGARSVAFEPVLEELDLVNIPAFLDERIVAAINEGLNSQKKKLAWGLSRALSLRLALPKRITPKGRFELLANDAKLRVTDQAIELSVSFAGRVVHVFDPVPVSDPAFARS
jgi:hypothetical protein